LKKGKYKKITIKDRNDAGRSKEKRTLSLETEKNTMGIDIMEETLTIILWLCMMKVGGGMLVCECYCACVSYVLHNRLNVGLQQPVIS
jgi:hypothetical protein